MNHTDDYMPRGHTFTRLAIARAHALNAMRRGEAVPNGALAYAAKRWGSGSGATMVIKSATAAASSQDADWGSKLADTAQAATEFLECVRPATIIGRLDGIRRVPANVRVAAQSGGAVAFWRGESKAVKFRRMAFERATLRALHIAGMIVVSNEVLADEDPAAEALMRRDLIRATVELEDSSFIDPTNTGTANVSPAAVTAGAPGFTSNGLLEDDIAAALELFDGDLQTAAWVLHPRTAAQIALKARGKGVAAGLGVRGGELLGLPAIVSTGVPYTSDAGIIALVDAAGIALVDDGASIKATTEATVELDDSPTGAADTPTAASATLMSLWQTNQTGLIVTRAVNWRVARSGAVVVVSGCNYEGT